MRASTIAERQAAGRAAREHSKRSSHRALGDLQRDPLDLLRLASEGRVERLVPLRYGRMAASPFAFFRGSAILQAHDLGQVPHTGLVTPICGDAHLLNFAGFATPERQIVFDLNDFDEAAPGPFEWDLKRLAASLVLAARHMRLSRGAAEELVMTAADEYRERIAQYAERGALELWYDRITFDRMIESALPPEHRRAIRRGMEKAATRTHESMLESAAVREGDAWRIRAQPPALFHIDEAGALFNAGGSELAADGEQLYADYRKTLTAERSELLGQFALQDSVFKIADDGSVGARCLVLLATDHHDRPLFLQAKEAHRSAVAQSFAAAAPRHEGERVVHAQRLLQAASDLFLGWATDPSGRPFYVRQLNDVKLSAALEQFDSSVLQGYARLCGWALARAHARASGKAIELAAYIGSSDPFLEALTAYACAYADQVERDYERFVSACRRGELDARTDDEVLAGLRR
ncbi:DUF2252 domain-containing protein [Paraburkholderia flava]|uniref:DUF2252 domain-containing protein n=1 Tax=Paraburkholderia flava TaxID=2547393 RepID=UPI00105F6B60|nr:DUF2252 domain-containing protein [Paraburkholderia flava]